jgi:DivIVA domain-containing protein
MSDRTDLGYLNDLGVDHGFDVALRGYDRRQVDDYLAGLESQLATLRHERESAGDRVGML